MGRRFRSIVFAVLILASAGSVARADDASRLAAARELVATARIADLMRNVMPTMIAQIRPVLLQRNPNEKFVDEFLKRFSANMDHDLDRFADLGAQVYAREFSEDDLKAIIAFYKTQAGQDLVAKQPIIARAMMAAGNQWGQDMAQKIIADFAEEKQDGTQNP